MSFFILNKHLFIPIATICQLFVTTLLLLYKICNHIERHTNKRSNNIEYKITNMKRKIKRPGHNFFILNQLVSSRTLVILSLCR
jgi:hypothetical protein